MREQQIQSLKIDYLSRAMSANYIVFDILYTGQENLMGRPLLERKAILKQELQENDFVTIIDYMQKYGEAYFKGALEKGLEGIMAKRLASPYQPGIMSRDWIKIKKKLTLDLVVGGYIPGHGQRKSFFGGLLLGAYDSGKLKFIGRVGSGFSFRDLEEISRAFKIMKNAPFYRAPALQGVKWLQPELVVEVEAMEVTKKGHLRAPVYLRKRVDKSPEECTIDQLHLVNHKSSF